MLFKILFWFVLIAALVGVGVWAVVRTRTRRRQEQLWGALEGEPTLPEWTPEALGVSAVRVQGSSRAEEPDSGRREAKSSPLATAARAPAPAPPPKDEEALPASGDDTPTDSWTTDGEGEAADGLFQEPPSLEWWGDSDETGALLRALLEATGGSTALLRPDPSDGGFLVLAAAGAAADALHAREGAHRLGDIRLLEDLPRDLSTTVFGGDEAGLLPGIPPGAVGETAVRALAPAPAPRRLLVADVPADMPMDARAEHLFGLYADLLARVHDLPLTPPAPEPPTPPEDPLEVITKRLGAEIASARENGRPLALALVGPHDVNATAEADPEAIATAEAALRRRLEATDGTREVLPMGPLAFAAFCEADAHSAERWVAAVISAGVPLRIGVAIYGPRHVSPNVLRQEAAQALHQTYASDDAVVIVE